MIKNTVSWVLKNLTIQFPSEFSKTTVKMCQLEWVNNWSIGLATKQLKRKTCKSLFLTRCWRLLYFNEIMGPKKTLYLMTKQIFIDAIVWVYIYNLQSTNYNSTLWKCENIWGLLGLSKICDEFLWKREKFFVEVVTSRVVLADALAQNSFYWVLHSLLYF